MMFSKAFMCKISRLFKRLHAIPQRLIPAICLICGGQAEDANLCQACLLQLPIVPEHCLQCARSLRINSSQPQCGSCLSSSPAFDRTFALFPYRSPITKMISKLKYQHDFAYARCFSTLLLQSIQQQWYVHQPLPDLIIPMPLHPQRLRERGFNQCFIIASPIARALKIPISLGVTRCKPTKPQLGLTAKARKDNVKNAFTAHRSFAGKTVVVLEDVITTGSTIRSCCETLKTAGAKGIQVWCCARRM